jgi:hypothetical protein
MKTINKLFLTMYAHKEALSMSKDCPECQKVIQKWIDEICEQLVNETAKKFRSLDSDNCLEQF